MKKTKGFLSILNRYIQLSPAVFLSCAAFAQSQTVSPSQMMNHIFDGPPELSKSALDPAAYVETRVQKLANPKIVYVNWSAVTRILKKLGYENLPDHLTPEVAKAILDVAGFAKQLDGEPVDAYLPQFRTLYSSRYGGLWLNGNLGSGRNGASGLVDVKGVGRTELVRSWANGSHSNGAMNIGDSVKEAIWSRIFAHELPYGANETLFIISTGTKVNPQDPNSEERTLLVREDSNRPAYFQPNISVDHEWMTPEQKQHHTAADRLRMEKVFTTLNGVIAFAK